MKKLIKNSGYFLLMWLSLTVVISTILFFFNISITCINLFISFIISAVLSYLFNNKDKSFLLKVVSLSTIIIVLSIIISTFMFDRSSDGNTYHKDAIGVLKEGFNPIYQSSFDFIEKRSDGDGKLTNYSIWIDHYAKANWIIAANIYSLTNNIESGKAMNIISIYIVFSILFGNLLEIFNTKKALLLSLIVAINPITASQMFTYYNDQLVYLFLILSIFFLIKLDSNINDKKSWFYYFLTFTVLSNTKFNGLGYLLVFSFLFVCKYLYQAYNNNSFLKIFKKLCLIFIPLFITAIFVVGYPTYIKNTIDHHNPFFPLYDKNGEDIITAQEPKSFITMNNLEKLFYATFSKANNLRENDNTDLKLPFTIYKSEIIPAMSNDLRISGWGIFYSGLLLCSIIIFIKYYNKYKKGNFIIYTLAITILLLLIMSESWWARYTPHFYLFIILSLYIIFKYGKNKIIATIYTALILINTLIPLMGNSYYTLKNSIKIRNDLNSLSNKEIKLNVNGMNGIIYNLKDYHVIYHITEEKQNQELYYHYLNYQGEEHE